MHDIKRVRFKVKRRQINIQNFLILEFPEQICLLRYIVITVNGVMKDLERSRHLLDVAWCQIIKPVYSLCIHRVLNVKGNIYKM